MACVGQLSIHLAHRIQLMFVLPIAMVSSVIAKTGQVVIHFLQSVHLVLSILISKGFILWKKDKRAPNGQRKEH